MQVLAQAIGLVAMVFNILSFQCKSDRKLMLMLGMGCMLFSFNYLLVGAYASAIFNGGNILRSILFVNKKTHNHIGFAIVIAFYLAVAIPTYAGPWTLILLSSELVSTYAIWYRGGAFVRKAHFFYITPIWLVNNIFFAFTIGGIICEVFTLTSVVVSLIRYGKEGFEV